MMMTLLGISSMVLRTLLLGMFISISRVHSSSPLRKQGLLKIISQEVSMLGLTHRVRVHDHLDRVHHPLLHRPQGRDKASRHPPLVGKVTRIRIFSTVGPRVDKVSLLLCLKGKIKITNNSHRRVSHLLIVRRDLVREVPLTLVFCRVHLNQII
jgi:hypothetical protein